MPEPRTTRPKRDRIAEQLKQRMFDGQLRDGMRVPTIRELAAEWDVTHGTVQAAIEQLRTEGLVRVVHGEGTFATPGRAIWGPQQAMRSTRYPYGQRVEVRAAALVEAPRYVAGIIHTPMAVRREWLTYGMGPVAITLSVSWTPSWAITDVPQLGHLYPLADPGGAAAMIASATGQPLSWGWCARESRRPRNDGREIPLLHLTADEYVLAEVVTWGTGDGETSQTVEYLEFVTGPNRVVESELVP